MSRCFTGGVIAVILCCAGACSNGNSNPVSPDPSTVTDATANPDGSTLKVAAPALQSPVGGVQLDNLRPTFVTSVANALFADASFTYRIRLMAMDGNVIYTSPELNADNGNVTHQLPDDLPLNTRFRWSARAELGGRVGPWAEPAEFVSDDYRGLVPRPPDGNWPSGGPSVVSYIAASFPDLLRRTSTVEERVRNMEFLRDRIIEAGVCGGLDLARNLKRGRGPHSIDALAWRLGNGRVEVVDLASGYDDNSQTLKLHWFIVAGPPGYDPLPDHPGC